MRVPLKAYPSPLRPQSRSASARNGGRGRYSSSRRNSESSLSASEDDSDEEDFFTGESDADFVSLSSGSNPRHAPRKSWMCEHCTYVNNPGVSVCAMCCRTSLQGREEKNKQGPRTGF